MNYSIRILLVEDTPIAQIMVKTQMIKQGCMVDIAENGIIALKKALINPYDLILMDIGLGDGPDGFEVTLQIKNQSIINKTTPVVAVTSHESLDYQKRAKEVGMEHYFKKPFTSDDAKTIVDCIKKQLNDKPKKHS